MLRSHRRVVECVHESTVSVIHGGLERVVCEDCGHVMVRYESMISGDVDRSKFSRRADTIAAERGAHSKPAVGLVT